MESSEDRTPPSSDNSQARLNQTVYPEVMQPSHDILTPKVTLLDAPSKTAAAQRKDAITDRKHEEISLPTDGFPDNSQDCGNPSSLGDIAAPVSHDDSAMQESPASTYPSKANPQDKASRYKVSASETAKLTEVIKTALVGAPIHGDDHLVQSGLPAQRSPVTSAGHINPVDCPPTKHNCKDLEAQQKAKEVIKTLQDLGYIIHKDPNHSSKPKNPGFAASVKSGKRGVCPKCNKFEGRPCELTYVYLYLLCLSVDIY